VRSDGNKVFEVNGTIAGEVAGEAWALFEPIVRKKCVIVKINLIDPPNKVKMLKSPSAPSGTGIAAKLIRKVVKRPIFLNNFSKSAVKI